MDRLEPPPFKASRHRFILLPLSYDKRPAVSSSRAFPDSLGDTAPGTHDQREGGGEANENTARNARTVRVMSGGILPIPVKT